MGANDAEARVRMIIPSQRQLTLTCKLALLAIDPESGRLRGSIGFGLAAAALLDLTHAGRIALGDPEVRSIRSGCSSASSRGTNASSPSSGCAH